MIQEPDLSSQTPRAPRIPNRILGVIPARLASTRLPRKVLREIAGKPLLAWTYEAALACTQLSDVVIAADSADVALLCRQEGWPCVMTSPDLPSGTDRLHAVSQMGYPAEIFVNLQADEPLLQPEHVAALLQPFTQPHVDVTTLKVPLAPGSPNIENPNAVKVVTAADGRALYFSRATIPYHRDAADPAPQYWKHMGLYAYRDAALQRFPGLPPSSLERAERLEQLRLLEAGISLYVCAVPAELDTVGVDTEADLQRVESLLLSRKRHRTI